MKDTQPPHGLGQALAVLTVVGLSTLGVELGDSVVVAQGAGGIVVGALAVVYAVAARRIWPDDADGDGIPD